MFATTALLGKLGLTATYFEVATTKWPPQCRDEWQVIRCGICEKLKAYSVQLSKDEEGEETEVRREDQDKINRFSTLHQKEKLLQADLKTKEVRSRLNMRVQNYMVDLYIVQKEKEDLEEVSSELELADEDEKVS